MCEKRAKPKGNNHKQTFLNYNSPEAGVGQPIENRRTRNLILEVLSSVLRTTYNSITVMIIQKSIKFRV